ncbi:MAG: outer membrane beta-barrel protein [Planctomycetota bacterium]
MTIFLLRICPLALAFVFCLGYCATGAQNDATKEPEDKGSFEPRGIRSGKLVILPAMSYTLTYTDNSLRTSSHEQRDALQEFLPSLQVIFDRDGVASFNLTATSGWHDYLRDTAKDYLSHAMNAELGLNHIFADGLSFTLADQYLQSGNTSALDNEMIAFTRYQSNKSDFKTEYRFNRFAISGQYSFLLTDYFDRVNSAANYVTHSGTLEGSYELVPERARIFGSYKFNRTLYLLTDTNDFDSHELLTGMRGVYGKLTYTVGAGYAKSIALRANQQNDGPIVSATLNYTPQRRLNFILNANRTFVAGISEGATMNTALNFNMRITLTQRGTLVLSAMLNNSAHANGESLTTILGSGNFEYKLSRHVWATVGFTHTEHTTTSGAGNFIINEAQVNFRLAW